MLEMIIIVIQVLLTITLLIVKVLKLTILSGSGCNKSPPWFMKHLPSTTNDNVEKRLCKPAGSGSTPIEIVELYVQ